MNESFLSHLRNKFQVSDRDSVTLSVRVSQEENAAIQDLADTAGCSRQDVLYELIEKYAIPAFNALKLEELKNPELVDDIEHSDSSSPVFFLINTNKANDVDDHKFMLENARVAAFEDGYIQKIEKIKKGDVVFLYESGVGIRAKGVASGNVEKTDHYGVENKTYYQQLDDFLIAKKPIPAKKICSLLGRKVPFIQTMTRMKDGEILLNEFQLQ